MRLSDLLGVWERDEGRSGLWICWQTDEDLLTVFSPKQTKTRNDFFEMSKKNFTV